MKDRGRAEIFAGQPMVNSAQGFTQDGNASCSDAMAKPIARPRTINAAASL
jgi:hypothetical protein